jgi:hypothetical protein
MGCVFDIINVIYIVLCNCVYIYSGIFFVGILSTDGYINGMCGVFVWLKLVFFWWFFVLVLF